MVTEARDRRINTDVKRRNDGAKRMPHERDESPEGQDLGTRGIIEQAASDLEEGLVDTDLHGQRGVESTVQRKEGGQAKPQANAGHGMRDRKPGGRG